MSLIEELKALVASTEETQDIASQLQTWLPSNSGLIERSPATIMAEACEVFAILAGYQDAGARFTGEQIQALRDRFQAPPYVRRHHPDERAQALALAHRMAEELKGREWLTRNAAENIYCPSCETPDDRWIDQAYHRPGCSYAALMEAAKALPAGPPPALYCEIHGRSDRHCLHGRDGSACADCTPACPMICAGLVGRRPAPQDPRE